MVAGFNIGFTFPTITDPPPGISQGSGTRENHCYTYGTCLGNSFFFFFKSRLALCSAGVTKL
jgi:hypothetical protein